MALSPWSVSWYRVSKVFAHFDSAIDIFVQVSGEPCHGLRYTDGNKEIVEEIDVERIEELIIICINLGELFSVEVCPFVVELSDQ